LKRRALALTLPAVVFLGVLSSSGISAADTSIRPLSGSVVEVKATSAATRFIWDATSYVTQLAADHIGDRSGLQALEATAVRALAGAAKDVRGQELQLKVSYTKLGAVNPAYGDPTFTGVEPLLTLKTTSADLEKNAESWAASLAAGKIPGGVSIAVTGALPPAK
jgi:hypothetical protein